MNFPSDDRYVRFTFADTHRVAGLLREFLPAELLACLDLERLKRLHENQIHDTLRESRDDLNLWRVMDQLRVLQFFSGELRTSFL